MARWSLRQAIRLFEAAFQIGIPPLPFHACPKILSLGLSLIASSLVLDHQPEHPLKHQPNPEQSLGPIQEVVYLKAHE
jgi:hypothetical protein